MYNLLGRTLPRTSSAVGIPADHDAAPALSLPLLTTIMTSPSPVVHTNTLYPLPSIQPTNKLYLRSVEQIEGTWVIDSGMRIPRSVLNLTNKEHTGARTNVQLNSQGGGIIAKLYIVPISSPLSFLGFGMKAVTIRADSSQGGDIRLIIVSHSVYERQPAQSDNPHACSWMLKDWLVNPACTARHCT